MSRKLRGYSHYSKEKYLTAFLLGFGVLIASLLPVMLADRGYFIYYGDYNAQQMPFYNLVNDAVRSGQFGWNWYTDLGSDLLTSYSFYLIGSPFFWLSVLLPRGLVTLSMPFLLALKHGLASMTAYAYIRRFVRSKNAALTGALLYAFSGFQVYNIFFNHFQDVTALFPLMLIALEELVNNRRRGWFALTVALMAFINYYFFTGQAVFLVLYFIIRARCEDFRASWRSFASVAAEAVIGTLMACAVLLPSAVAILGNYRVNEHIYGQSMIMYSDKTRIPRIIQSFFMPVDAPARPNLFQSDYGKWSSIGGYFPLFSMIGVITFMREHRRHWAARLSLIAIICAFIPVLNSSFYTFNASYYARWFYMPILIFAMMTARTLDDARSDVRPAIKICAGMLAAFAVISVLPDKVGGRLKFFAFADDLPYFYITLGVAVLLLIAAAVVFRRRDKGLAFRRLSVWAAALASVVCVLTTVLYGANSPKTAKKYIDSAINGSGQVYEAVSGDNFFRADTSPDRDNYPMFWGLPCMRAFQSVVETSIMDFYASIGVQRDVASRADTTHYTLRGLFSVKYFYRYCDDEETKVEEDLPGFELVSEGEYFDVYENTLFVPMGFAYDTCVSEKTADAKGPQVRERMLMKCLVLTDEQIERYSDIITVKDPTAASTLSQLSYREFCEEKRECCASSFKYDSHGFTSEISLDSPRLVFFSVPYSSGWSAEVNGKPADVEKVSYGLMAVRAESGDNTIVFRYRTPGLTAGLILSGVGLLALVLWLLLSRVTRRKGGAPALSHYYDYDSYHKISASQAYTDTLTRR
ncbi:MAG: YfhO family protein [Ruminococcus sp.]|nr:YfhO family protein [Ruminococcus sp.]